MIKRILRKIAVLDDYQHAAVDFADWASLAAVKLFVHDHIRDPEQLATRVGDCDVLVLMRERTPVPAMLLDRLPTLRLIVTAGRRNAAIDVEAATARGIQVCGTETLGHPTAELTWGLILALARQIPHEVSGLKAGGWQSTVGLDLRGRTLGIFGLGRLGSRVAAVARAFEMNVLAYSPSLTAERAAAGGASLASKDEALAQSDFVTLHMPLNAGTRGFIDEAAFKVMKPSSFLINTSRSAIVDEAALLWALTTRRIGGAALDVFPVEPVPPGLPLLALDSVLATPHLGYVTQDNLRLIYTQAVEAIAAFAEGAEPLRPLNRV